MNNSLVIGISGGTGSGKTTFASKIINKMNSDEVILIEQDSYYKDLSNMSLQEREKVNFDHPDAIDNDLLINHILSLKQYKKINKPVYDFVSHTRKQHCIELSPSKIIIVEGILIFVDKQLRDLFDIKIFIDTDDDVRLLRRISRDLNERGRFFKDVKNQYLETVKPMHLEFVEPAKRWADIIIPEGGFNVVGVDMVLSRITNIIQT